MSKIDEIAQYAGSSSFGSVPRMPYYPYLRINGNDGGFVLTKRNGDKSEKESVGGTASVIILRVRRRLTDFASGMSTTEHNHKGDNVTLFQTDPDTGKTHKVQSGVAEQIRAAYPVLGTEQVVYSLFNSELVRLVVRGGSLGSENEPKGSTSFYDYLGKFKGDSHVWMYHTNLSCIQKTNKKLRKNYYAINFEQGDKLSDVELDIVADYMKTLFDLINIQDEYNKNVKGPRVNTGPKVKEGVDEPQEETVPIINLDDENEIKPDEIPF